MQGCPNPRPNPAGFSILPGRQHFYQGCLPGWIENAAGLWSLGNVFGRAWRIHVIIIKSSGSPAKSQIFVGTTVNGATPVKCVPTSMLSEETPHVHPVSSTWHYPHVPEIEKSGQEARHMYVLNVLDEIGEGMTLKRVSDVEEGADVVALLRLHLNNSRCHLQLVALVWPLASAQLLWRCHTL